MLLVSGATTTMRPLVEREPRIFGTLVVPRDGNSLPEVGKWAADNGAFTGFDEALFLRLLQRHRYAQGRCVWVAAPDVVGDAAATLELFREWEPRIREYGYPVALVAQDGLTVATTPWDRLDCIFVGGSTEWKLGPQAAHIAQEARARGKWLHVGRVNTRRRLKYCAALGADSVDGSGWSKFPDEMLRRHGGLIRSLSDQRRMLLDLCEAEAR